MAPLGPPPPESEKIQFHVWKRKRDRISALQNGPWQPTGTQIEGTGVYIDLSCTYADVVYFLECPALNRVKIGITSDLQKRVGDIQRISPLEDLVLLTSVPGDRELESSLHRAFADDRLHGEWFNASPRMQACIEHLKRLTQPGTGTEVVMARGRR